MLVSQAYSVFWLYIMAKQRILVDAETPTPKQISITGKIN